MSRFGGVFWFVLVVVTGMTNFIVKQTVQNLDDQLTSVRRQTVAEQKKIHELTADWTFLNQPELLADLNNRYVHLGSVSPKQVAAGIDAIPLRPIPPPDAAPSVPAAPPSAAQPILPVSVTTTAHAPAVQIAAAAPPRVASPPAAPAPHSASLDALFAQVASDR